MFNMGKTGNTPYKGGCDMKVIVEDKNGKVLTFEELSQKKITLQAYYDVAFRNKVVCIEKEEKE